MYYRIRSSGDIKTQGEVRKMHTNVSLPRTWDETVFELLGIDPVLPTAQPAPSSLYKVVSYGGAVQDANGNWVQAWLEQDMFSDTPEATKAEQEAAYKAMKDAEQAKAIRQQRGEKLKETDWTQVADAPVDKAAWAAYRQALRDITGQEGFPWTIDWPVAP
jgi:hypothetical protein